MLVTQIETARHNTLETNSESSPRDCVARLRRRLVLVLAALVGVMHSPTCGAAEPPALSTDNLDRCVARFNSLDTASDSLTIPNEAAAAWLGGNVPRFACPDPQLEETYYFRWWTFRKHLRQTPQCFVITEFLAPVKHAGAYNTISCAFGHHLAEGSWLRDPRPIDEYTLFWFRGNDGEPMSHFHKFSSWAAAAIWSRYLVNGDRTFVADLLDDLVRDYERWEAERRAPNGLFWQYDVADGMEESISGSRTRKNLRPTINSYMAANAQAIARIARLACNSEVASTFDDKSRALRKRLIDELWDHDAQFFKVRFEDDGLSDAREAIGFVPWMFNVPEPAQEVAWKQLMDPTGFSAPRGLTTAERRHPLFRSHGTGTCEWDGAVWPFATSQTLSGLLNVLRGSPQQYVTRRDFWQNLKSYAASHLKNGKPYIGEYFDELTGDWLIAGKKEARSRDYNHSTFCDLIIRGVVGIVPREDDTFEIDPLIPADEWDWFCLDKVRYHGHDLTIAWDRDGTRFRRGAGLAVWVDGSEIARNKSLGRLTGRLPATVANK